MVERLTVEPGGKAKLRGWCKGDAINYGGDLTVLSGAVIEGALQGRSFIRVMPGEKISDWVRRRPYSEKGTAHWRNLTAPQLPIRVRVG